MHSSIYYWTCTNDATFLATYIILIFISPPETITSKNTSAVLLLQSKKNTSPRTNPTMLQRAETSYATVLAVANTLSTLVNSSTHLHM